MRKNVIIVGMPRSGTSMAARIFASQGYFAAKEPEKELREGDEFNPKGYWEAQLLIDANVEVLKAVGYPHHNTWIFDPITNEQAARLAAVDKMPKHRELVETYNTNAPWVWKDPRLCYTLGYWWPLMNPETTAVLLLTRNVESIFQSFLRVGWRKNLDEFDEVAKRVHDHMAAAERTLEQFKIPHIKMDYDDFAARPGETADRIGAMFQLKLRAHDLGFEEVLNHSGAKGRLLARIEKIGLSLPHSVRAIIKRFTPQRVIDRLFPGRRK